MLRPQVRIEDLELFIITFTASRQENLRFLIERGAQMKVSDEEENVIHAIARSKLDDSVECLRLLLEDHGEDIEVRNCDNQTPLHVAANGEF